MDMRDCAVHGGEAEEGGEKGLLVCSVVHGVMA